MPSNDTSTEPTTWRPGLLWIDDLDERGLGDLFAAEADGSGARRLVDGEVISAVWSPDGRRIAIMRDDLDADDSEPVHRYGIYVVNADGTDLRLVTPTVAEPYTSSGGLTWSPDGTTLAYHDGVCTTMGCHVSLWTVDVATGTTTRLTMGACDFAPAWSPDGDRIAFVRYVGTASQVWSVAPDGSDLRAVTPLFDAATNPLSDYISSPAWSPDGAVIAYERGWDVWLVGADGANARPLLDDSSDAWRHSPVWAPDGSRLVVLDWGDDGQYQMLVVSPDGIVERAIATDRALEWDPSWSPDGRTVIAARATPRTRLTVYAHPVDGSPPVDLGVTGRSPRFAPF